MKYVDTGRNGNGRRRGYTVGTPIGTASESTMRGYTPARRASARVETRYERDEGDRVRAPLMSEDTEADDGIGDASRDLYG